MAVTITLLDATRQIKPHAALLQHTIAAALDQIRAHVRLDNLDITVTPFQAGKASPSGIGGYALSPHRVELMIDCQRDDLATVIETELLDVLAHEVHHSLRLAHHAGGYAARAE